MVILVAKDDVFNRTFERWHTKAFSSQDHTLAMGTTDVQVYLSIVGARRR
jgi:hypothetical protein